MISELQGVWVLLYPSAVTQGTREKGTLSSGACPGHAAGFDPRPCPCKPGPSWAGVSLLKGRQMDVVLDAIAGLPLVLQLPRKRSCCPHRGRREGQVFPEAVVVSAGESG